jgi:Tfp pilus assembly protein PilE
MNNEELIEEISILKKELEKTKNELLETKEQLNKYLLRNKNYYEKNKEKHITNVKKYKEQTNYVYNPTQEQKKEWARTAYLNKKSRLEKEKLENPNI